MLATSTSDDDILASTSLSSGDEIFDAVARFHDDPLGFVYYVWPWGETGGLSDQEGPDRWQIQVLTRIRDYLRDGGTAQGALQIAVASGHGIGKALAHGEPVLTPHGWVPIESLRVGDRVIAGDGTATRVRGVFPQGQRELFRVTMSDGSSVVADGDHQWFTTTRSERKHGKPGRVRTTREIAASLTFQNGQTPGLNHEIPVAQAVQHPTALLPVEPYLFGCWLGDGAAMGRITGEQPQFDALEAAGAVMGTVGRDRRRPNVITRTPLGIARGLRALGVLGCRAHEKSIPRAYLHADVRQRTALLQGLLDTDGTVGKGNAVVFETTSPALGDDVAELARSLGGVVRRGHRRGSYGGRLCREVYRLYLSLPRDVAPFRLPTKVARYQPRWGEGNCDRTRRRFISSIEPIGRGLATCISVEHPSELFITRDHIVTHNTALIAWIIIWFIATRPNPQIVVTANTKAQLDGKTWRELAKWHKSSRVASWFKWTATKFYQADNPEDWFASAVPWTKERSEAFAGTHEKHVLVIFDEGSAIDDAIWEVVEGAMTTHGAMWIAFGNPTRNTGRFRECFGRFKHRWWTLQVDSRTAKMANRAKLQQWIDDYGEDSDFVRVRVKGVFPRASTNQLIAVDAVEDAMNRVMDWELARDFPVILGVDIARFGDDQTVVVLRQGQCSKVLHRWRELDTMQVAGRVAEILLDLKPDATFVDLGAMGSGVYDRLRQLGFEKVHGVNFGGASIEDKKYANKRAEIWLSLRDWLKRGGCLPAGDVELRDDLIGPEYGFDANQRYQLERKEDMKARGLSSPDSGDAYALTFAEPVTSIPRQKELGRVARLLAGIGDQGVRAGRSWMSN